MGGAALPLVGMSVGLGIVQASRIAPAPYDVHVAYLGIGLLYASVIVFAMAMLVFAILWLRYTWVKLFK